MSTPPLHIVIATGQNQANLIPALQCRAQEVWILETPAMQRLRSAAHLVTALNARGIAARTLPFADDDVTTLHRQAERIAREVGSRAVTINFTGGTKPMTLALVQTLAADLATAPGAEPPHLVYCDTKNRRLDWLAPQPRSEAMQPVLGIDDILLVQGYRRVGGTGGPNLAGWQAAAQERADLTRWLGEHSAELGGFLGALNHVANAARADPHRHKPFEPEQRLRHIPNGAPKELLRRACAHGLISWGGADTVHFHDDSAAQYLGGGWVEELAALKMRGLRPNGGWEPRLCIEHVDTRTRNELDAVLVHDNRMLVVECKAARPDDDLSDWIYKLAKLAEAVGGQMAQAMLLSAREMNQAQRNRAKEYRVDVLSAGELRQLPERLRHWTQA